jgi:hypothetical protein
MEFEHTISVMERTKTIRAASVISSKDTAELYFPAA